mmetsp:Transcript_29566/g.71157  ORF Transcript_29566/g.71157 Transcript_29566/m.71157 type:complete len:226 (+) Transcript_29566:273-950(+)
MIMTRMAKLGTGSRTWKPQSIAKMMPTTKAGVTTNLERQNHKESRRISGVDLVMALTIRTEPLLMECPSDVIRALLPPCAFVGAAKSPGLPFSWFVSTSLVESLSSLAGGTKLAATMMVDMEELAVPRASIAEPRKRNGASASNKARCRGGIQAVRNPKMDAMKPAEVKVFLHALMVLLNTPNRISPAFSSSVALVFPIAEGDLIDSIAPVISTAAIAEFPSFFC